MYWQSEIANVEVDLCSVSQFVELDCLGCRRLKIGPGRRIVRILLPQPWALRSARPKIVPLHKQQVGRPRCWVNPALRPPCSSVSKRTWPFAQYWRALVSLFVFAAVELGNGTWQDGFARAGVGFPQHAAPSTPAVVKTEAGHKSTRHVWRGSRAGHQGHRVAREVPARHVAGNI